MARKNFFLSWNDTNKEFWNRDGVANGVGVFLVCYLTNSLPCYITDHKSFTTNDDFPVIFCIVCIPVTNFSSKIPYKKKTLKTSL